MIICEILLQTGSKLDWNHVQAAKKEHRIAASRAIHSVAPASRRPSGAWEKPLVTSVPSKDTTVAQHPQSAQASLPSAAPRSRKAARAASAAANRSSSQPVHYSPDTLEPLNSASMRSCITFVGIKYDVVRYFCHVCIAQLVC